MGKNTTFHLPSSRRTRILLVFFVLCVWVIACGYARRDVLYLMKISNESNGQFHLGRQNENLIFATGFYQGSNYEFWGDIVWLKDSENAQMKSLITGGIVTSGPGTENYHQIGTKYGRFYVLPKWADFLCIKYILLPLQPRIEMLYFPDENLIFFSEDRKELGYDFCKGLSITNVPPALLHFMRK